MAGNESMLRMSVLIPIIASATALPASLWAVYNTGRGADSASLPVYVSHADTTANSAERLQSGEAMALSALTAPEEGQVVTESETPGSLAREIAALKDRFSRLESRMAVYDASIARHLNTSNDDHASDETSALTLDGTGGPVNGGDEARNAAELERQQFVGKYSTRFQNEDTDMSWANEVASLVENAMRSEELKETHLGSVECHSSLCRLSVFHDSGTAYEQFMLWFGTKITPSVTMIVPDMRENMANGGGSATYYMVRGRERGQG